MTSRLRQLSGLDGAFLYLESPATPMHVGALLQLDLPDGCAGDYFQALRRHIGGRLHLADVLHCRLAPTPFDFAAPAWLDHGEVDLDRHLHEVALPSPGTDRQLEQIAAHLHALPLDRSRPLWSCWLIRGLANGRIALYIKVHHAAVDGQAGVALARALMDTDPTAPGTAPETAPNVAAGRVHPCPGALARAGASVRKDVERCAAGAVRLPGLLAAAVGAWHASRAAGDPWPGTLRDNLRLPPRTPFNVTITAERSFAARSIAVVDVRAISRRVDVSFNDVVLAACAGALRRYLQSRRALPARPLTAAMAMNLRRSGDVTGNNQVALAPVVLATDIADPVERLAAIARSAGASRRLAPLLRASPLADLPSFGTPWLISGVTALHRRAGGAERLPALASLVISSVAGPSAPLHLAGARVRNWHPLSIVTHGLALNITIQRYAGSLEIGLIACARAIADLDRLGDLLADEFTVLDRAARDSRPDD